MALFGLCWQMPVVFCDHTIHVHCKSFFFLNTSVKNLYLKDKCRCTFTHFNLWLFRVSNIKKFTGIFNWDFICLNDMPMLLLHVIPFMFRKNINCSMSESLQRFEAVCKAARKNNIPVRGWGFHTNFMTVLICIQQMFHNNNVC